MTAASLHVVKWHIIHHQYLCQLPGQGAKIGVNIGNHVLDDVVFPIISLPFGAGPAAVWAKPAPQKSHSSTVKAGFEPSFKYATCAPFRNL